MSASLENQFISDKYTSLLHLSGSNLNNNLDFVYDGLGNQTPIQVSNDKVVINNVEQPPSLTNSTIKFFDLMFPVNSIYLTADNTNPTTRFSGTTWELVSEGRYLAGIGTGSDINGVSKTITEGSNLDSTGEYEHVLTISELPNHSHDQNNRIESSRQLVDRSLGISVQRGRSDDIDDGNSSLSTKTTSTGESQSHNNTPPYFGVYVWKRTS
tara:strand:- start:4584 stop:5219 length:636 start_codon:yes stop_codon:yes gene_type:complete